MPGPSEDFVVPTKYAAYGPVPVGVPAVVTAVEVMMLSGYFFNPGAIGTAPITLTVQDGNAQPIHTETIPPLSKAEIDAGWGIFTGLKWGCDGVLYGQLVGYPTV